MVHLILPVTFSTISQIPYLKYQVEVHLGVTGEEHDSLLVAHQSKAPARDMKEYKPFRGRYGSRHHAAGKQSEKKQNVQTRE